MGRKRIEGRRPGLLTRIFHTRRSRRREEGDGPNGGTSPPPHVGGYRMWAFHARYEISGLGGASVLPGRLPGALAPPQQPPPPPIPGLPKPRILVFLFCQK